MDYYESCILGLLSYLLSNSVKYEMTAIDKTNLTTSRTTASKIFTSLIKDKLKLFDPIYNWAQSNKGHAQYNIYSVQIGARSTRDVG